MLTITQSQAARVLACRAAAAIGTANQSLDDEDEHFRAALLDVATNRCVRPDAPGETPGSSYRLTCPGYFRTLGIPIVRGRDFNDSDRRAAEGVVIVNEAAAERYWPGQEPLGKRLRLTVNARDPWLTVVGVVRNVRHFGLDSDTRREIFRPIPRPHGRR